MMPSNNRKRKLLKPLPQTGQIKDPIADIAIKALAPGKRISRTGNIYWETRINRSDRIGRNI